LEKLLSIGKILNFHGVRGEVKVGFSPGNEKLFSPRRIIYVEKASEVLELEIEQVKFHKKFALIKFKGIDSINEVIELKGCLLKLPKSELDRYLEEDEFYIADLVGIKAVDTNGSVLGVISGVVNIGAQDTLLLKDLDGREHMVPFNRELVPDVNLKAGRITVNPIEGLLN
jgi:16S rRNA processing protein RimM